MKFLYLIAIFPILYVALTFISSKKYFVHERGIVLITGASTGIGLHAAISLAGTKPAFIVKAGVRKESDFKSISNLGISNLQPILIDVTSSTSCEKAIEELSVESDKLKIPIIAVVNNAGISRNVPVEMHSMDDAKLVFETNFFGMLRVTQLALPLLRKNRGRIVMISSVAGFIGTPLSGIYAASKHAMEGLSDALRKELAHIGISVSIVEPAYVNTPIFGRSSEGSSAATREEALDIDEVYAKFYSDEVKAKKKREIEKAVEPHVTSDAIIDALVSPSPATRYQAAYAAGMHASFIRFLWKLLPDRVLDFIQENV